MLLGIKAVETKHFTFTVTPNISWIILVRGKKEKLCFDTNKLIIKLITKAIILVENPFGENYSFYTHSIINLL